MSPFTIQNRPKYHHLTRETALAEADGLIENMPEPPRPFEGRGLTICGGGLRYFTCAWVCIRMLRELGCELPIQLWHLDAEEMTGEMRSLVAPLGVECVDASEMRKKHPARSLCGWALKPYSIAYSPFREVLALDADNVPVVNPEFLFDTPEYGETGALFWPDYWRFEPDDPVWAIFGVPYFDAPQFESGQIVIDKGRCWEPLRLALWYNENSDFYYRYILGDKDTFQFGFRRLGFDFSMPSRPIENLSDTTMCQHDFEGRRIFQHRNLRKWELFGGNDPVPGFLLEKECFGTLDELRQQWDGRLPGQHRYRPEIEAEEKSESPGAGESIFGEWWLHGLDESQRRIHLREDGVVTGGEEPARFWDLENEDDDEKKSLVLASERAILCRLKRQSDGDWRGYLARDRRRYVGLRRPHRLDRPLLIKSVMDELIAKPWAYRRVGHDQRTLTFEEGGAIGEGAADCEMFWEIIEIEGRPCLEIASLDEITCRLFRRPRGGRWRGDWRVHEKMPVQLIPLRMEPHHGSAADPTMPGIVSQLATQQQVESGAYRTWCRMLEEVPRYHRRQWEYVFVLAAYEESGFMEKEPACVGIGEVGGPLASALMGCGSRQVTLIRTSGGREPPNRESLIARLNDRQLCDREIFRERLVLSETESEMDFLREHAGKIDFIWSLGHLSHLGDSEAVADFLVESAETLSPGGVAVHLADYRVSEPVAGEKNLESTPVLDGDGVEQIVTRLRRRGFKMTFNPQTGSGCVDEYADAPPYGDDHHLKLLRDGEVFTSIGLVIRKPV